MYQFLSDIEYSTESSIQLYWVYLLGSIVHLITRIRFCIGIFFADFEIRDFFCFWFLRNNLTTLSTQYSKKKIAMLNQLSVQPTSIHLWIIIDTAQWVQSHHQVLHFVYIFIDFNEKTKKNKKIVIHTINIIANFNNLPLWSNKIRVSQ